ncbi:von Willebrand factor-like [Saccoglossus kowalevskii]
MKRMSILVFTIVFLAITCQSNARVVKRADGNPHDLMVPGQGQASQCLSCGEQEKLSLVECLMKPLADRYEQCETSRPECMTELTWKKKNGKDKLVFASRCMQIEACIEKEANEPGINNCDDPPIHVATKCRYCCNNNTLTQGYFCPPPRDVVTCTVHGDPRFKTFDEYKYHEGGDCASYTIFHSEFENHVLDIEVTESKHESHYRVETLTVKQDTDIVELSINDYINPVEIKFGGGVITPTFPQFVGSSMQILLTKTDNDYEVLIDLDWDGFPDLVVEWGFRRVELQLSQPYSGCFDVIGLCGDANGTPDNEMITPSNTNVNDPSEFHKSWGTGC